MCRVYLYDVFIGEDKIGSYVTEQHAKQVTSYIKNKGSDSIVKKRDIGNKKELYLEYEGGYYEQNGWLPIMFDNKLDKEKIDKFLS